MAVGSSFHGSNRRVGQRTPKAGIDTGPRERWQHSGRLLKATECPGVVVACVMDEHVLDFLNARRLVSDEQRTAGLRLAADYRGAGLAARVGGSYSPLRGAFNPFDGDDRTDAQEAAYQRWCKAVQAVPVAGRDRVISVACENQMPLLRTLPILTDGLAALVRWYGLPIAQPKPLRSLHKEIDVRAPRDATPQGPGTT